MSKRIGFKIIIGISFLALAAVIASYFLADFQFNTAKRLESAYLWKKAGDKYRSAINLDPFNAQYLAGYAEFLKDKSPYQKNRVYQLESAGKLYGRALELDPRNAEYALHLGQVELGLFSLDKHKFKDSLSHGIDALRRAIENDPNDADMNYAAGYAAISAWDNLSVADKQWFLDRLRLSQESLTQSWQGKSRGGDSYMDGNMYWAGTVRRLVDMPAGKTFFRIRAKGSSADNIWPHIIVELDGVEIGERFVDSPEWKDYSFQIDTGGGVKVLSVTFANDGGNSVRHEDRNLFVGDILVEKP